MLRGLGHVGRRHRATTSLDWSCGRHASRRGELEVRAHGWGCRSIAGAAQASHNHAGTLRRLAGSAHLFCRWRCYMRSRAATKAMEPKSRASSPSRAELAAPSSCPGHCQSTSAPRAAHARGHGGSAQRRHLLHACPTRCSSTRVNNLIPVCTPREVVNNLLSSKPHCQSGDGVGRPWSAAKWRVADFELFRYTFERFRAISMLDAHAKLCHVPRGSQIL